MGIFDEFDKEFGFTTTEPSEDMFSQFDKEFGFTEEPTAAPAIQTEMPLEPATETTQIGTTAIQPAEPIEPEPRIFAPDTGQQIAEEIFTGKGAELEEPEPTPGIQPIRSLIEGVKQVPRQLAQYMKGSALASKGESEKYLEDSKRKAKEYKKKADEFRAKGDEKSASAWDRFARIQEDEVKKHTSDIGVFKEIDKASNYVVEAYQPDPEFKKATGLKGYVQDVIMIAPQITTQIAATAAGGPAAGVAFMGGQIAGGKYEQLVEQGVEPERALAAGITDAVLQAPLEQIGIGKVMSVWKPGKTASKVLKEIVEAGGTEFVTEWLQAYPEAITEIWAKSKGKSNQERAEQFVGDFWEVTKNGLYQGLVAFPLGAAGAGGGAAVTAQTQRQEALKRGDIVPEGFVKTEEGKVVRKEFVEKGLPALEEEVKAVSPEERRVREEKYEAEKAAEKAPPITEEEKPIVKKFEPYKPTEEELAKLPKPPPIEKTGIKEMPKEPPKPAPKKETLPPLKEEIESKPLYRGGISFETERPGIHLTPEKTTAEEFAKRTKGKVETYNVDIKNPLRTEDRQTALEEVFDKQKAKDIILGEYSKYPDAKKIYDEMGDQFDESLLEEKLLIPALKKKGYDGLILEVGQNEKPEVVVFSKEQLTPVKPLKEEIKEAIEPEKPVGEKDVTRYISDKHKDTEFLLHPSTEKVGNWQVTQMKDGDPHGHTIYPSKQEAIDAIHGKGKEPEIWGDDSWKIAEVVKPKAPEKPVEKPEKAKEPEKPLLAKGLQKYPNEIYEAIETSTGARFTKKEIDSWDFDEVRRDAEPGLEGGRDEFNKLVGKAPKEEKVDIKRKQYKNKLVSNVIKEHGTTENVGDIGFILTDGRAVKSEQRGIDHRQMALDALPEDTKITEPGEALDEFLDKTESIRVLNAGKALNIDIRTEPTDQQLNKIEKLADIAKEIYVDISEGKRKDSGSFNNKREFLKFVNSFYRGEGYRPPSLAQQYHLKKQIAPTTFKESLTEVEKKVSPELWKRSKITFAEHYGNKGQYTLKKGDKGAIWYDKGRFNIVINPANTAQETATTLFHEIAGHAGAANVLKQNPTIAKRMNSLYKLQKDSDLVKKIREAYKEEMAKDPTKAEDLVYSEWIASNVEQHLANPKKQGVAYQVWKHIKKFLIDLGVAKDSVDDVINSMVGEIRKVKGIKGEVAATVELAKDIEKAKPKTETPEFKKWFGESKVKDEKGKPLVVYHGTDEDFDVFDKNLRGKNFGDTKSKKGWFFTETKEMAKSYGEKQIPLYLSVKNPLKIDAKKVLKTERDYLIKKGEFDGSFDKFVKDFLGEFGPYGYVEQAINSYVDSAIDDNKDGVIIDFGDLEDPDFGKLKKVIIAFEPTQIKSAIGNVGTFKETEPSILKKKKIKKPIKRRKPKPKPTPEPTTMLAKDISTNKVPEETFSERFVQKWVDKRYRLKVLQDIITPDISEDMDTYTKAELIDSKIESMLDEFEDNHFKPLREKLVKADIPLEKFEEYLYARHAKERNAYINKINPEFREKDIAGSGMEDVEADAILSEVKKSEKANQYNELGKIVDDITSRIRRVLFDAGLIDAETKKAWENYKYYVPLRGIGEEETRMKVGRGFDIRGKESKRALGRKSKARNILSHLVIQMNEAIVRANKNKVGQVFLRYVRENPNPDLWEIDEVQIKPKFNENTGEVEYKEEKVRVYKDPKTGKLIEPMSVKVDGKEYHITIKNLGLAKAMVNMGAEKANIVVQVTGYVNRYLAMVNTSLSAGFIPTNFGRDIQTALINIAGEKELSLKESISVGKDIAKNSIVKAMPAVWSVERGGKESEWTQWYREFKQEGGKIGFFGLRGIDRVQKELVQEISLLKPGNKNQIRKYARALKHFVLNANEAVENGTRLATYVAMRKRGVSKQRAASIAKNITVNFNKKGEYGAMMNAFYIFSNASVQGVARLYRAIKHPRVRKIVGSITVGSFLLAQMNRWLAGEDDDDENYYDKIPDWIKENNIIIMRPGIKTLDKDGFLNSIHYFKFPVPYGYNIFHALGQATDKAVHNRNKDSLLESAAMVGSAIGNAFNPLGSSASWLQTITPTIGRWATDLSLNKNFFGAPIMKEEKFGVPKAKAHQYFKSTSEQSKQIAQTLNDLTGGSKYQPGMIDISPDLMDYVAEYFTGSAGRQINQLISVASKVATKKEVSVRSIPVVRRFLGEVPEFQNVQTFYEHSDKLKAIRADYKEYLKTNPRKAAEIREKQKPKLRVTMKQPFSPQFLRVAYPNYYASLKQKRTIRSTELNIMQKELKELNKRKKRFDELGNLRKKKEYEDKIQATVKQFNKRLGGLK